MNILEVHDLKVHFPLSRRLFGPPPDHVRAVDGVNLEIRRGETLGLVGESGCGKTSFGRTIVRVHTPTAGSILYRDPLGRITDLALLPKKELAPFRRKIRMIFQDPQSSLNPRHTILQIVGEPLIVNLHLKGRALEERVADLLAKVGLRSEYLRRYPHAFSGGERQRIGIARALALDPELVIADEAVSALDVSVQAQTLNLLSDLHAELNLTYLFVAHNLSVVRHVSNRVAVMYVGKIVELASTEGLFTNPRHPYTEALLSAVPKPDPRLRGVGKRIRLSGEVPDPAHPPGGCHFHPRCRYATDRCAAETPALRVLSDGHLAACHRAEELSLQGVRA